MAQPMRRRHQQAVHFMLLTPLTAHSLQCFVEDDLEEGANLPIHFAGSLRSRKRAAAIMSLIQSARLNGHVPYAYLKDVVTRLSTQQDSEISELLPHRWTREYSKKLNRYAGQRNMGRFSKN
jgi:hypothetical protein